MHMPTVWNAVLGAVDIAPQGDVGPYVVGLTEIFTFLFVMLGPLKILGPFANQTRLAEPAARRNLALRSTVIAIIAVLLGGFVGRSLLAKWQVSLAALFLAAGVVFLLVALRIVLEQYEPKDEGIATPSPSAFQFAFPTIVTPYGMAAVILMLTSSHDQQRTTAIVGLVLIVMVLNLLAMLFARPILKALLLPLALLGAVLGVLQVALAIQLIISGLKLLGVAG